MWWVSWKYTEVTNPVHDSSWVHEACGQVWNAIKHTRNHKDALLKTRKISRIEKSAKILGSEDSLISKSKGIDKLSVSMVKDSIKALKL